MNINTYLLKFRVQQFQLVYSVLQTAKPADIIEWTARQRFFMVWSFHVCTCYLEESPVAVACFFHARQERLKESPPAFPIPWVLKEESIDTCGNTVHRPADSIAPKCRLFYSRIVRRWCLFFTKLWARADAYSQESCGLQRKHASFEFFFVQLKYSFARNCQASHPCMKAYLFPVPKKITETYLPQFRYVLLLIVSSVNPFIEVHYSVTLRSRPYHPCIAGTAQKVKSWCSTYTKMKLVSCLCQAKLARLKKWKMKSEKKRADFFQYFSQELRAFLSKQSVLAFVKNRRELFSHWHVGYALKIDVEHWKDLKRKQPWRRSVPVSLLAHHQFAWSKKRRWRRNGRPQLARLNKSVRRGTPASVPHPPARRRLELLTGIRPSPRTVTVPYSRQINPLCPYRRLVTISPRFGTRFILAHMSSSQI